MRKRLNPKWFPDYTDKKVIDGTLDRLDTAGVSRRSFLKFVSFTAVASATAGTLGIPALAIADPKIKMAELLMSNRLQYDVIANKGAQGAARALGMNTSELDGQFNSNRQLNQFQQEAAKGVNAVLLHAPGGGSIRRIAQLANQDKIYMDNTWGTLPWFTPFDAGDYYTMYAEPDCFDAMRASVDALCQAIMEKFGGGQVVRVTGVPGNSTDIIRSRGGNAALKDFPKIELAGQLPGNWNRGDSRKAMESLISRYPKLVGVIAQNDDQAQGCLAALRGAGIRPGKDVLVCGADGTAEGAEAILHGEQVSTCANVPAFMGGFLTARLYDVVSGWQPTAPERLMNWYSVPTTRKNVKAYISRYVHNGGVEPFNYELMSRVKHPHDWDPQNKVYPMDIDVTWGGIKKPAGWKYPAAYVQARKNGESKAIEQLYHEHYKTPIFGPSPMKKA